MSKAFDLLLSKSEVSENTRCYEYIQEQLAVHHGHFMNDAETKAVETMDVWGYYKDGRSKIVFFANAFNKVIKEAGFQSRTFLGWAKAKKLIEFDKGRFQKTVKWNNSTIKAIVLSLPSDIEVNEETGFVTVSEDTLNELPFDV